MVEGEDVFLLVLGEGLTSRAAGPAGMDNSDLTRLREDLQSACDLLGVKGVSFCGLPDNRLDTVALLDIVQGIEMVIADVEPDTVYMHHPSDLNVDHSLAARAVLTATRPSGDCPVRDVYAYEVPSSTDWSFGASGTAFRPNYFVDITSTIDKKIGALRCYGTEIREFPHPRSPEALRACAARWGSTVGCEAAEAFEIMRRLDPERTGAV